MTELIERGARVDYVTLTEQLQSEGELMHCGGAGYVLSLTDGLPRVKNITQYARIVKEKARSRMLINVCETAPTANRISPATTASSSPNSAPAQPERT